MKKYSRYIIAFTCLLIIVFRLIFPELKFDIISVSLLAIATLSILIKEPEKVFEKTKKIKLGSFEWELQELNKNVEKIEESIVEVTKGSRGLSGAVGEALKMQDNNLSSDYSIQILKLSMGIEKTLNEIFDFYFKEKEKKPLSTIKLIEKLIKSKVIDIETGDLLRNFWKLRNRLIHEHDNEIDRRDFISFGDIGIRILITTRNNLSDGKLPHYGMN